MEEMWVIAAAFLVIISVSIVHIMKLRHVPNKRISESLKENILQDGLIHFTRYQDALNIQKNGLIAGKKKSMYNNGMAIYQQ